MVPEDIPAEVLIQEGEEEMLAQQQQEAERIEQEARIVEEEIMDINNMDINMLRDVLGRNLLQLSARISRLIYILKECRDVAPYNNVVMTSENIPEDLPPRIGAEFIIRSIFTQ